MPSIIAFRMDDTHPSHPHAASLAELERRHALAEEAGEGFGQLRMAFGPFLSLATLEYLLVGRDLMGAYLSWLGPAL